MRRPHECYLLLSTGPIALDGAPDRAARWRRDLLVDLILAHLPEVWHRTRAWWPQ